MYEMCIQDMFFLSFLYVNMIMRYMKRIFLLLCLVMLCIKYI